MKGKNAITVETLSYAYNPIIITVEGMSGILGVYQLSRGGHSQRGHRMEC